MTGADRDSGLGDVELRFFGEVTASISHELNNAIAIIDQTAGLLADLAAVGECKNVAQDRLQRIIDTIDNQARRGATIVKKLNAFAHSVDAIDHEIELNELAQNVVALAQRMAERRGVQLHSVPATTRIPICGNLFRMQHALFSSIRSVVSIVPEGSRIEVSAGLDDATPWVAVESDLVESSSNPDVQHLRPLIQQVGGELESKFGDGRILIRLRFTNRPRPSQASQPR